MRSRYADTFHHNDNALAYDQQVLNESDPVRAGYADTLRWVAAQSPNTPTDLPLLELGCGTGNLTQHLTGPVQAVDISDRMIALARNKTAGRQDIEFILDDLLDFSGRFGTPIRGMVSTYALHHLTDDEKSLLLNTLAPRLVPGGAIVIGDLMFSDASERARMISDFQAADLGHLIESIEEEFYWDGDQARSWLEDLGMAVKARRFSRLSWGLVATRPH